MADHRALCLVKHSNKFGVYPEVTENNQSFLTEIEHSDCCEDRKGSWGGLKSSYRNV